MERRWIAVTSCLLGLWVAAGCQGPRVTEYEPGRFYFDWDEADRVSSDQRHAVRRSFEQRVEVLAASLQEPVVTRAVKASNVATRELQLGEILDRDERWQRSTDDSVVDELTEPRCNQALRRLSEAFEGFAEILVTDLRGVNVCVTAKTSDYYQGDEEWWQSATTLAEPQAGPLEHDESADLIGVPAYLPILDPVNGRRIGTAKAIIEHRF